MKFSLMMIFLNISYLFSQGFWGNEWPDPKIPYNPKTYVCYKVNSPIIMDGKLDDLAWESTKWTDYFVDIEGNLKPKPFYKTRVKMLWDETYFYFAVDMEEPHVWAKLKQRDTVIFKDNDFEIFLDPDGDTHNYYELEVNALETEWDLILLKPYHNASKGDKDVVVDSWDIPGLITKVHVDGTINNPKDRDKGWSVEIAIPWKALISNYRSNTPPKDGEQWKVNFSRVQWDVDIINDKYVKTDSPEYNWVWSPQGLIYMHTPETWGLVQFTDENTNNKNIKFIPNKLDQTKWALRHLFYRQSNHYLNHNRYTESVKKLGLKTKPVSGVKWPPIISVTPSGWEAVIDDNNQKIYIRKDGKTWAEDL